MISGRSYDQRLRNSLSRGFTIVELLIVVGVIAILAAITIVAYGGIQDQARSAATLSAAKQVAEKVTIYSLDNKGQYPGALSEIGIADTGSTTYQYRVANGTSPKFWCVTTTVKNQSAWTSSEEPTPQQGACPGHGAGGAEVIENLAKDPRATTLSLGGQGRWERDRWNAYGTYSTISGITNHPDGITTAARFTVTSGRTNLGFHLASNPQGSLPDSAGYNRLLDVDGATTYAVSLWLRKSGATTDFRLYLRCASSANTWMANATSEAVSVGNSQWVKVAYVYETPSGCDRLAMMVAETGVGSSTNDTIDGTGLMITKGATIRNYADGDSPGWIWQGTPNDSTSVGQAK